MSTARAHSSMLTLLIAIALATPALASNSTHSVGNSTARFRDALKASYRAAKVHHGLRSSAASPRPAYYCQEEVQACGQAMAARPHEFVDCGTCVCTEW